MIKEEQQQIIIKKRCEFDDSVQKHHTPWKLCREIILQLVEYTDSKFWDKPDILVMFNLEFVHILISEFDVNPENITFTSDSEGRRNFAEKILRVNILEDNLFELMRKDKVGENIMKKQFDVILGNPPYHKKRDKEDTKTQAIWQDFVELSFKVCKKNGYICLVHPSGWRGNGMYNKVGNKIKSHQVEYLEMHDEKDGMKIFKAETRYDWYVIKNCPNINNTTIKDQKGIISEINIKNMEIIPNFKISIVQNLFDKDGEDKVEILADSSYHTQSGFKKGFMSEEKTEKFKYPCVYVVNFKGKIKLWYSSVRKEHFGISKLIFSNGRISSANYFIDKKGEYGLTQFSYGIIDESSNFENIYKAMRTKEFKEVMEACSIGMLSINKDVLRLFRKDFWKEFV